MLRSLCLLENFVISLEATGSAETAAMTDTVTVLCWSHGLCFQSAINVTEGTMAAIRT